MRAPRFAILCGFPVLAAGGLAFSMIGGEGVREACPGSQGSSARVQASEVEFAEVPAPRSPVTALRAGGSLAPRPVPPSREDAEGILEALDVASAPGSEGGEDLGALGERELAETRLALLDDPAAIPVLDRTVLEGPDPMHRIFALDSLANVDPQRARDLSSQVLRTSGEASERQAAVILLAHLGAHEEGLEALRRALLSDPSTGVRGAAAMALLEIGGPSLEADLRQALALEREPAVRDTLVAAIDSASRRR